MVVYNFSKVKQRDKKIYTVYNAAISQQGISIYRIKIAVLLLFIFNIFGIVFCNITDTFWYNPINFVENSNAGYFYLIFIFLPILLSGFLTTYKIQNYKLFDFLVIYLTPRFALNQEGKIVKLEKNSQYGFVEII